jgi:hypothetical protein
MKTKRVYILASLALTVAASAQSINVTSTGVGIGTATPAQKLDVAGNVNVAGSLTVTGAISSPPSSLPAASIAGLGSLATVSIYTSPELTYVNGGVSTVAHGLGKTPLFWTAIMRCVATDLNYAVGDEIPIQGDYNQISTYSVSANATNFTFSIYNAGLCIAGKNGGATFGVLTPSKWRIVFRAINL